MKSYWKRSFLEALLGTLEERLGIEILTKVPENLRDVHLLIFKNLTIIEKLRRQGILEKVEVLNPPPDEPPLYRVHTKGHLRASGASFLDPEKALWSALGECVERSLWSGSSEWYEKKIKVSSYKELPGDKIDPRSITGFSEEQKSLDPMLQVDESTVLGWVQAKEKISGKMIWVPLQLFSAEYCQKRQKSPERPENVEPLLRSAVTTGLATSSHSHEEAVLYGALEAIERDAFMICWLKRLSPPRIDINHLAEQDDDLKSILDSLARYHLRAELLLLPTDFPFLVIAAVLLDESGKGPAFTMGAKAHWDMKTAILGALSEAASVRFSLKTAYEAPVDMKKVGRKERLIYWAKEENTPKRSFLTQGEIRKITLEENKSDTGTESLRLSEALRNKKYPLYEVEISSEASRRSGFRSVCVHIPDLQPMHLDERVPALAGKRLAEIPSLLGYEPAKEMNPEPHPFP
ncbi:YcaO-like family protein [Candidatus Parcubacteria bacterium]|nr:YcaO-like family protein [Candidatus Parcubacteria bacterium]